MKQNKITYTNENRPSISFTNLETNEVETRKMNDDEWATYEIDQAAEVARKAEAEAKAAEKQALLDKLGITADEAKLLLG